jgi:RIB43A
MSSGVAVSPFLSPCFALLHSHAMIASIGANPMTLERERSRVEGLRARNEERTGRYLNARLRLIGVDKQGLDAQVAEREAAKQRERDAAAAEFAREQHIQALMEQRDAEERELRRIEIERVRAERDAQRLEKHQRTAAERESFLAPLVPAACGPSALQTFSGEDAARKAREAAQKDQMRAWTAQQAADKRAREEAEAEAAARYHDYLMAVTAARGVQQEQEDAARADLRARTRDCNLELAEEKAAREEAWRQLQAEADARELAAREAALLETMGHQYDAEGHVQVCVLCFLVHVHS